VGFSARLSAGAALLAAMLLASVVVPPAPAVAEQPPDCLPHKSTAVDGKCRPDSDRDGLTDQDERKTFGTDPTSADTDSDGLADGLENQLGTDPTSADTDSDGLADGLEIVLGP
jgi:hypothetical protein